MCKYCDEDYEDIIVKDSTTDKPCDDYYTTINIYGDDKQLGIVADNLGKDGYHIDINFCPMCGKELGIKDKVAVSIGYTSFSNMYYKMDDWDPLYRRVVEKLFLDNGEDIRGY